MDSSDVAVPPINIAAAVAANLVAPHQTEREDLAVDDLDFAMLRLTMTKTLLSQCRQRCILIGGSDTSSLMSSNFTFHQPHRR